MEPFGWLVQYIIKQKTREKKLLDKLEEKGHLTKAEKDDINKD